MTRTDDNPTPVNPTLANATLANPELTWKRFALRSLLPIAAVVLLLLTPLIGPFGFAVAVAAWWLVQRRF